MSLKYLSKCPAVLLQNVGVIRMDLLINLSIVNDNNLCSWGDSDNINWFLLGLEAFGSFIILVEHIRFWRNIFVAI